MNDDAFEWEFPPKPSEHVWVTKDDRRLNINDMSETHVRNTLKLIMRRAHEGRIWAIKPSTGGLRHYTKEEIVASVTVKKIPQAPKDAYDDVSEITLVISVEEAKALHAVAYHTEQNTVGGKALYGISLALNRQGLPRVEDQDVLGGLTRPISFKR